MVLFSVSAETLARWTADEDRFVFRSVQTGNKVVEGVGSRCNVADVRGHAWRSHVQLVGCERSGVDIDSSEDIEGIVV